MPISFPLGFSSILLGSLFFLSNSAQLIQDKAQSGLVAVYHFVSEIKRAAPIYLLNVKEVDKPALLKSSFHLEIKQLIHPIENTDSELIYYLRGKDSFAKKEYRNAIIYFSLSINLNPHFFQSYYGRALATRQLSSFTGTNITTDTNISVSSNAEDYPVSDADKSSIYDLTKAIQLKSDFAEAYYHRGRIQIGEYLLCDISGIDCPPIFRDFEQNGIEDLNKAINLNPNLVAAYLVRGNYFNHKAFNSRINENNLSNSDNSLYRQQAIKDFINLVKIDPNFFDLYNEPDNLSMLDPYYHDLDSDLEFENYFDTIRKLDIINNGDKDSGSYLIRGFANLKIGNFTESINDFSEVISLNNSEADAYYGRGWARYRSGDFDGAKSDLNKAILLQPDCADCYVILSIISYELNDISSAFNNISKVFNMDPDKKIAYLVQYIILASLGKDDQGSLYSAIGCLLGCQGGSSLSGNPETYYQQANNLARRGDIQKAINCLSKAISLFKEQNNQEGVTKSLELLTRLQTRQ
jgi:tetratricopeptide (TPR) repeat protein